MKYANAQDVGTAIFKELLPEVTLMLREMRGEPARFKNSKGQYGMKSRWFAKKPKGKK